MTERMKSDTERSKRLRVAIRAMDDGMGIVRDDYDEAVIGRYAHFADGPHSRNVYTSDDPKPDPLYVDWAHVATLDLDRDLDRWGRTQEQIVSDMEMDRQAARDGYNPSR